MPVASAAGSEALTLILRSLFLDIINFGPRGDGALRALVNVKLKDVRARVMANNV